MQILRNALLLGSAVLLLAACNGQPEESSQMVTDSQLQGDAWHVQRLNGETVGNAIITLDFHSPGKLAGKAACNQYMASYSLSDEAVSITTGGMTMMACAEPLMMLEKQFIDVLGAVTAMEIDSEGTLILSGKDGQTIEASRSLNAN